MFIDGLFQHFFIRHQHTLGHLAAYGVVHDGKGIYDGMATLASVKSCSWLRSF